MISTHSENIELVSRAHDVKTLDIIFRALKDHFAGNYCEVTQRTSDMFTIYIHGLSYKEDCKIELNEFSYHISTYDYKYYDIRTKPFISQVNAGMKRIKSERKITDYLKSNGIVKQVSIGNFDALQYNRWDKFRSEFHEEFKFRNDQLNHAIELFYKETPYASQVSQMHSYKYVIEKFSRSLWHWLALIEFYNLNIRD